MLDVAMLLLVAIFFGLAISYANLCHRLLAPSDEAGKDAS